MYLLLFRIKKLLHRWLTIKALTEINQNLPSRRCLTTTILNYFNASMSTHAKHALSRGCLLPSTPMNVCQCTHREGGGEGGGEKRKAEQVKVEGCNTREYGDTSVCNVSRGVSRFHARRQRMRSSRRREMCTRDAYSHGRGYTTTNTTTTTTTLADYAMVSNNSTYYSHAHLHGILITCGILRNNRRARSGYSREYGT